MTARAADAATAATAATGTAEVQVVLRQDVDNLGLRGEVVSVARGYARNYLLPRGLAEPATPGLVAELARREAQHARHQAHNVDEAQALVASLEASELRFEVKAGPTGSLFGSVTATSVADRLWETQKIRIDRRKLELAPIKRIGRYTAPIEVFNGVSAELHLLVVPEGGELPPDEELEAAAHGESEADERVDTTTLEARALSERPSSASDDVMSADGASELGSAGSEDASDATDAGISPGG
jgi:large subunit ribosomal protein L9